MVSRKWWVEGMGEFSRKILLWIILGWSSLIHPSSTSFSPRSSCTIELGCGLNVESIPVFKNADVRLQIILFGFYIALSLL